MVRKFTEIAKTENSYIKQGLTQVSEVQVWPLIFPQDSSGIVQLPMTLPEWSEDPTRWEKLPLPFSRGFLKPCYWYQRGCCEDSGCMPASSLGANN